jgi:glycosyltransferase involved in cell wall biosynthesis
MVIWRIYYQIIQWLINHYIDGQTAITQRLADNLHIPPQKCWGVWESGVDLELFEPCIKDRDWSQIEHSVHLIYVGTLNDGRNVGVFCQAVIKRALAGENFIFTVVGSGYEAQSIAQLAKEYPNIIHYHQPVPHKDIPSWLSKAHLGVLPFPNELKFQVSSPIKLFEYLASGLGIIATRIVAHEDYLMDSEFVFWSKNSTIEHFEDALQQVWNNRIYLPELSKKAVLKAQSWSWEKAAYKLYQSLLKGLSK